MARRQRQLNILEKVEFSAVQFNMILQKWIIYLWKNGSYPLRWFQIFTTKMNPRKQNQVSNTARQSRSGTNIDYGLLASSALLAYALMYNWILLKKKNQNVRNYTCLSLFVFYLSMFVLVCPCLCWFVPVCVGLSLFVLFVPVCVF